MTDGRPQPIGSGTTPKNALKNEAVAAQEYVHAAKLRDNERTLLAHRTELLQRLPPTPPTPDEK